MKTNYKILFFTFIINIFAALSLNSFSTSSMYIPALFLYFLTNLASSVDKIAYYSDTKLRAESAVSWFCFGSCSIVICCLIANSLDFIEITFQCNNGIYSILMQGIQNSFFTFDSINITPAILACVIFTIGTYFLLWLFPLLREHGYTKPLFITCFHKYWWILIILSVASVGVGFLGICICNQKYINCNCGYGQPQYLKYFISWASIFFGISYAILLHHCKKSQPGI